MQQFDFDTLVNRLGSYSAKHDEHSSDHPFGTLQMAVADMDFRAPQPVLDALQHTLDRGVFGYTILPEEYPTWVTRWMQRRYDCAISVDWVLFSPRINMAAIMAVETFTNPGERIIVHTPAYSALVDCITKTGRTMLESPLIQQNGEWQMDFETLESMLDGSEKMLLLCNPHNPTGRVWHPDELNKLVDFCLKHHLLLLSDDIHADIIRQTSTYTCILKYEAILNQVLLCNSLTKTLNLPGCIFSNIIIPNPTLREQMKTTIDKQGLHNPNIFAASLLEAAYTQCDNWISALNRYIDNNMQLCASYMAQNLPSLQFSIPEGSFLLWIDYRPLGLSEDKMQSLFEQAKVIPYMGSHFGPAGQGFFRLNIATSRSTLCAALERITQIFSPYISK